MRNMTWMTAAVVALALMAYTPSDAKAQYVVSPGYGYNTAYVPAYGYGYPAYGYGYNSFYRPYYGGSGVSVVTPGFAFSYGNPGFYRGGYGGGWGGYRGGYYGGGYGRRWR